MVVWRCLSGLGSERGLVRERVGDGRGRACSAGRRHVVWVSVCSEGLAPVGDGCGLEGPWWVPESGLQSGAGGVGGMCCRRETYP